MKHSLSALILAVAAASPAAAQDETIGVRWREWFVKINGHIQGQGDNVPAADINLTSTLGLDDQENGHEIQLYLSLPVLGRFYAGYWWVDFEGDETLTRDITFADVTFSASTTVESTLNLDMYYLTYEFLLPSIPLGGDTMRLDVGVQLGARALLADASIESSGLSGEDDGAVGTPVIGVRGALQLAQFVRAELEIAGMSIRYGDSSMRYVEGFAEVVGQLGPVFGGVGYKWCSLDFHDSSGDVDFQADFKLDGFYLTAGLRF
jgi:hypothetical protein